MSLRVWLPLTGDLHNQGLEDVSLTASANSSISQGGKIGSCYQFGTSTSSYLKFNDVNFIKSFTECSVSLWVKILTWQSSYNTYFQFGFSGVNWAHYIFGLLRNSTGSTLCFTISNGSSATNANCLTPSLELNKWYHFVLTYKDGHCKIYMNGQMTKDYSTSIVPDFSKVTFGTIGAGGPSGGSYQTNCLINDFRVYDHCLSPKEIEELSKGLILHYKLDKNFNQLNNCYSYPTFNTSSSNGGWSHWGNSGHKGSYGQNTDQQYIYNKNNTYSHWIADGSDDTSETKRYLMYQGPAFDGGYRSIQFIIKEENSLPITETICYPGWNARNGGAIQNKWTSIDNLGNGFYLCKVEGASQDGSDDLIGVNVKAGYKVYFSEAYCENDREVCSDIFNQDSLTSIIDSSGYGNNATSANITSLADSPKYDLSSVFNGTNSYVKVTNNNWNPQGMEQMTINIWAKATTWPTNGGRLLSCTETGGFNLEAGNSGYWRFPIHVYTNAEKTSTAYKYDSKEILISSLIPDEWNMITLVYDAATGTKTYINGELHHTYSNVSYGIHFNTSARLFLGCEANTASAYTPYFNGKESDFRIYVTALTAEQIKELYDTSMGIDSNGNVYAREVIE